MRIVTADFAGAAYPPGTKVSFTTETDGTLYGTVQGLLPQRARVATRQGMLWKVPYSLLTVMEPTHEPAMLLTEVATLGKQLIREHEVKSGLKTGWQFAFDLAPARGGLCRYREKQITLSVTYCLKASKEEIVDTILHEIAHAIVGPKHGHNASMENSRTTDWLHGRTVPQRPAYIPTLVRTVRMWSTMGTTTLESTRKNIKMSEMQREH